MDHETTIIFGNYTHQAFQRAITGPNLTSGSGPKVGFKTVYFLQKWRCAPGLSFAKKSTKHTNLWQDDFLIFSWENHS